LQLPRAICDAEGIPEKRKKSSAVSVFKSLYPEAFTSTVKQTVPHCPTAFIIDAIFIFNYVPLSFQSFQNMQNFFLTDGLYAPTIFMVLQRFMIFDDPNRHGMSPKDTKMQKRQRFNTGFRFFRYLLTIKLAFIYFC